MVTYQQLGESCMVEIAESKISSSSIEKTCSSAPALSSTVSTMSVTLSVMILSFLYG